MSANPNLSQPTLGDFNRDWNNIASAGDYQSLNMLDSEGAQAAQNLMNSSLAESQLANEAALSNYTSAAMQNAAQSGMRNVYGSENSYGAQGAGMSGAAQAAAAAGMASPIAQAQQQIAGLSAQQTGALNAQRGANAASLAETYAGLVAPQYTSNMSSGELGLMNQMLGNNGS